MAGFSIVMLILLFFWPVALAVAVLYLAFEAAALVITSPAFPLLVVSMLTCVLGCANAALVMWRRFRDPEGHPITLRAFRWTLVLFGVSFVALCLGTWQAGVALLGLWRTVDGG